MSAEHAQLGIDKAEEALRRIAVLEGCFAAFDDWIAIRFEGDPTLEALDERLVAARGGESPISDLEATDQWRCEHAAQMDEQQDDTGQDRWYVAWSEWVNTAQPTITLREAFQAGFSASGKIDLEAADRWCREHDAHVDYLPADQWPVRVVVRAPGRNEHRGVGGTLAEAVENARVRHAQVAAVEEQ